MSTNTATFIFLSITLLVSSYTISYPSQSFAQTTTLDVAGKWDGTIKFTVSFEYDGNKISCGFSGTSSALLSQSGKHVWGPISGTVRGNIGNPELCNQEYAGSYKYNIDGTLTESSLSGTIGPGGFRGTFLGNTFDGSYNYGTELKGFITLKSVVTKAPDIDKDDVPDDIDNCMYNPNPDQANNDNDFLGDVCDPDDDNDGIQDLVDSCTFEEETKNNYQDNDGCPDTAPTDIDKSDIDKSDIDTQTTTCTLEEFKKLLNLPDSASKFLDALKCVDGLQGLSKDEKDFYKLFASFFTKEYGEGYSIIAFALKDKPSPESIFNFLIEIQKDYDLDKSHVFWGAFLGFLNYYEKNPDNYGKALLGNLLPFLDESQKIKALKILHERYGLELLTIFTDFDIFVTPKCPSLYFDEECKTKKTLAKFIESKRNENPFKIKTESDTTIEYFKSNELASKYVQGTKVFPGSTLEVKKGTANIEHEGTQIEIQPNSKVKVGVKDSDKTKIDLLWGQIKVFFKKLDYQRVHKLTVDTTKAHAAISGTEFVTTHTEGITVFDIKEGTLQVTNLADGEVILVNSGNTVTVDNFATYVKPLMDEQWNILTDEFTSISTITEKTQLEEPESVPQPELEPVPEPELEPVPEPEIYDDESPEGYVDEPFHGDTPDYDDGYEDEDDYDFYEYEDPEKIVYGLHDLSYYNVEIEIPQHWEVFALIDKSEFPARTYYSMWYNTWMNWVEISLFHDIGQRIDLQNFDEGIRHYEDYKRQWCEETKENPVFLDEPDESGWQTCLELKDFDFKKITIDGREGIHVSYLMSEKFEFEDYPDETEFETWQFWENLIPYGDDVIVVTGETLSKNAGKQKSIILDSINSFKILNDGQPIFEETTSPALSRMISERELTGFTPTVSKIVTPTPTLEIIPTPNEKVSDLVSLKLDQSQVILKRHEPIQLKVSGELENYFRGARITFTITDPDGTTTEQKVIATKDGYFENILWFDFRAHNFGEYKMKAQYQGENSQTVSLKVKPPLEEKSKDVQPVKEKVPGWIKNNAKWWSEGQIGDSDFIGGIQYMIKEDIVSIPDLPEQASATAEEHVPDWIRNNAGWWSDGLISEDDFVSGIKWLVENGIIKV